MSRVQKYFNFNDIYNIRFFNSANSIIKYINLDKMLIYLIGNRIVACFILVLSEKLQSAFMLTYMCKFLLLDNTKYSL